MNRTTLGLVGCFVAIWTISHPSANTRAADSDQITTNRHTTTWDQWRGPHRDGVWNGRLPDQLDALTLVWEKSLSPSYSGPISNGTLVFTTETVDETHERVTAFDLQTGDQVWTVQWAGAMRVPRFAAANGSWIKATPAVNATSLVLLGIRDEVVSLNPVTGTEQWRVDLAERFGATRPKFGAVCSPIIDDEAVYVQGGGATVKLSLEDGSTLWRTLDGESDDDAFSSPIIATLAGVRQMVVQTRSRLCGVNLANGEVLWSEPIETFRNMNILTPTIIDNKVFTAAHSGRSHMFTVDHDNGQWTVKELWNQKTQAYMSSPVIMDRTIYLHAKSERLTALDVDTGAILWTSRPMGKYQSLVHNQRRILSLDSTGQLRLIKPNREELEIVQTRKVADDAWAYLGITDDGLLIRDLNILRYFRF